MKFVWLQKWADRIRIEQKWWPVHIRNISNIFAKNVRERFALSLFFFLTNEPSNSDIRPYNTESHIGIELFSLNADILSLCLQYLFYIFSISTGAIKKIIHCSLCDYCFAVYHLNYAHIVSWLNTNTWCCCCCCCLQNQMSNEREIKRLFSSFFLLLFGFEEIILNSIYQHTIRHTKYERNIAPNPSELCKLLLNNHMHKNIL